ncbi:MULTISPECIES: right-handed parallel beta-helix repeat-containing protein [Thermoanaerobacterium]|uniref:Parallel beta-helix repeat protein n=3 Tax=Thermoanaerobacterium TaxID=28895 RepID=A2ICH1_THESW|nr:MULTISPECIES: right-handed parallel beta-helix repeat-containing protein [Thermoanaerobacterium]3VST_A Chain A, Xylosidase [Thermoanaerobacterium saccharolyticum JW/SL-YS485]3VST_B Chain B, Xylosidase [Thermoanaerobacterium saccharolyticum JW/SL-YS485]3VST_C Chain C, Xylosidase [Thermoanaerobacterium saccharolyticum JW/SL-YS485]3VST_D Chain D, Xylosidase [Thermoanaerobacterium saccharolyticum JW/SL-YS485]3VSU_A Chain A, Xylosidase [Thermoanaerobacterium saccharolyticum JW/SL-YS485]3VSU_B C
MEYHVAKTGSDEGKGTLKDPFLTINKAASVAMAGDTIIVHEGVYREWVKPKYKGLSDKRRITYKAAEGEKVVIKGSERIQSWQRVEGNVWRCQLPNSFFGEFNPYKEEVFGDWLLTVNEKKHLGDVYLNGMSFYEVTNYEDLFNPQLRTEVLDHWTQKIVPIKNAEQTKYVWYAEVDREKTTIYANFQGADPNEEFVEINVRRSCFYPVETGIDYITVKGFEMAHAATPWAPPTADQPGLIGPNWSKGWIIEDNIIHDAKCSAISIGKEATTGNNYRSIRKDKPGYQYQLEAVFNAKRNGWSKEKIGSHIIRNNTIYDCGQNAIVGHLGGVFSEIYNNHIYNIALKREFYGHEIAGIKLHAAIDVQIHHNRIHDCSLGLWLDWEAQGTRVSKNLFYNNNRDVFVEVSHGPYLVDHNILSSEYAIDNMSQGGAYINNLIAGKMNQRKVLNRSTQYHLPHSTEVAGFAFVYGGDDRFYNNIFIGKEGLENVGTSHYNNCTTSLEEYIEKVNEVPGDLGEFERVEQPVYINKNAYFNGAEPFEKEKDNLVKKDFDPKLAIIDEGDEVYLSLQLPDEFENIVGDIHSTKTLERVRIVDAEYESPDGKELVLDTDYLDAKKPENSSIGPIALLKKGNNYIKVW